MRIIYALFLIVFLAALGVFAWQNGDPVTIRYGDRSITCPLSALAGGIYLLGMLTGWTVVGLLRRSWRRVRQPVPPK
jgi:hypothetical protein